MGHGGGEGQCEGCLINADHLRALEVTEPTASSCFLKELSKVNLQAKIKMEDWVTEVTCLLGVTEVTSLLGVTEVICLLHVPDVFSAVQLW